MSKLLCRGGCGNAATYRGWCRLKWKSKNKFCVACPIVESRRATSISEFRLKEAKEGKNPMQNSAVCAKNHSYKRNKKCSETLKEMGKLKLLPQQTENMILKEKRRKNISLSLKRLWSIGKHPRQLETYEKRKERINKMTEKLKKLGAMRLLPIQNMSTKQKEELSKKISISLREGLASGQIKLSKSWKKVPYKNLILRSEWERIVADFLDKQGLSWQYEPLKISYWDSTRKVRATTVPDFYIPATNTIIEVKSNAEYNSQQTKDKIRAIREKGFNFILVGRKEIASVKKNTGTFLTFMQPVIK